MPVDIGYTPSIRLNPIQELKITKPDIELYAGQILKTVVVKELNENQVLININGQNINANTAHHFDAGELLQVKVVLANGETILQVLHEPPFNAYTNGLVTSLAQTSVSDPFACLADCA